MNLKKSKGVYERVWRKKRKGKSCNYVFKNNLKIASVHTYNVYVIAYVSV